MCMGRRGNNSDYYDLYGQKFVERTSGVDERQRDMPRVRMAVFENQLSDQWALAFRGMSWAEAGSPQDGNSTNTNT
jgi:hypothetical protein